MGFFDRILAALGRKTKVSVLVIGLDNSGKTTIIQRLRMQRSANPAGLVNTTPTVGFNVEEFQKGSLAFTVFDMSGAGRYRNLWEQYYKDAQAIIFVIDSADKLRICVAKDELDTMLQSPELRRVPILFFANKSDAAGSLTAVDVARALKLDEIKDKPWQIVPSNALTGEGLNNGIDWLGDQIKALL